MGFNCRMRHCVFLQRRLSMIGKTVKHIRFGEGTITKEEKGKVYIQFDFGEKIFPYASFEKYLACDDHDLQKEFLEKAKAFKAEKEISEGKRSEELKKSLEKISDNKRNSYSRPTKKYNCWIKFEGPQNEMLPHEVMRVKDGNKTLFILNYVKSPSGVKDGAIVFVASGVQDDYGIPQQVITGKGILAGYDENNIVKPEWIAEHDWMAHYNNYLVLREYENLSVARRYGLTLNQVFAGVGADTYPSSEGQNVSLEELRRKHTQKMHMRITDKAAEYINSELDKLFKRYGSQFYRSDQ